MSSYAKTFFIAGTDTDIGKTFVACSILKAANAAGLSTAAIKPVAAGGIESSDAIHNEDALALQQCSSISLSYQQVNPVCFKQAIAPHIAAKNENRKMKASQLSGFCLRVMEQRANITLVEGAGGWKVPIGESEYISDMVKELQIPVILVVGMRIGCINHALLSAQAILDDGLCLAGWIANSMENQMPVYDENISTLKDLLPAPLLAEISFLGDSNQLSSAEEEINIHSIVNSVP